MRRLGRSRFRQPRGKRLVPEIPSDPGRLRRLEGKFFQCISHSGVEIWPDGGFAMGQHGAIKRLTDRKGPSPMPRFRTLDDLDVAGKRVLVRADLNVPVRDGKVTDATRIERLAPTIGAIIERGGKPVVMS